MPAKYAPSVMKYDRQTGKKWMEHYYIKTLSNERIFEILNDDKTKPKHKQKFRNVLTKRGVKIVRKRIET